MRKYLQTRTFLNPYADKMCSLYNKPLCKYRCTL